MYCNDLFCRTFICHPKCATLTYSNSTAWPSTAVLRCVHCAPPPPWPGVRSALTHASVRARARVGVFAGRRAGVCGRTGVLVRASVGPARWRCRRSDDRCGRSYSESVHQSKSGMCLGPDHMCLRQACPSSSSSPQPTMVVAEDRFPGGKMLADSCDGDCTKAYSITEGLVSDDVEYSATAEFT